MAEVERHGWDQVAERIIDEAKSATERVYVSLDVSVIDPAQLRAAGRAAPGGLTIRELAPLLRRLCAETQIAGFEIMDLAPMLDLSYVSAMNANYMMNTCLSGVAMRKLGLDDDNYLDPMTVDHGQN
jgi:agmatinase